MTASRTTRISSVCRAEAHADTEESLTHIGTLTLNGCGWTLARSPAVATGEIAVTGLDPLLEEIRGRDERER
jgi:hypothetical protein